MWTGPTRWSEGRELGSTPHSTCPFSALVSRLGGQDGTRGCLREHTAAMRGAQAVSWANGCSEEQRPLNKYPQMREVAKGYGGKRVCVRRWDITWGTLDNTASQLPCLIPLLLKLSHYSKTVWAKLPPSGKGGGPFPPVPFIPPRPCVLPLTFVITNAQYAFLSTA